jgi:hypothetical protein
MTQIWRRRLPFSKISYIPKQGNTFQKRINSRKRRTNYQNETFAERILQGPTSIGLQGRWCFFLQRPKYRENLKLVFQERERLFEKNALTGVKLDYHLTKSPDAQPIRSEAKWRILNNRRWKDSHDVYGSRRPYRRAQYAEWKFGRCWHPWGSCYQHRAQKITNLAELEFLQNHLHSFQRSLYVNRYSPIELNTLDFSRKKILINEVEEQYRAKWNNPNVPVVAKARRNWLRDWSQRRQQNPFLLGEISRAGSYRRNRPGRRNFSWWRLTGPILFDSPKSEKQAKQTWQYFSDFSQRLKMNSSNNDRFSFNPNKSPLGLHSTCFPFQPIVDNRVVSLGWIQEINVNRKRIFLNDSILWLQVQTNCLLIIIAPCSICLIIGARSVLSSSFNSVQKDFVYSLYRLIRRGGRIEIEPEWMEWILDVLGLLQRNAGIRIYQVQKTKRKTLVQQIAGLEKDIATFLNLLVYLRGWKNTIFLKKKKDIFIAENRVATSSWFDKYHPEPILLIGAPGTGKTSLVRALASESGVTVVYQALSGFIDASADFSSFGFGCTSAPNAVQRGFSEARSRTPVIFFLDEIDALGLNRSKSWTSKQEYLDQNYEPLISNILKQDETETEEQERILGLGQLLVEIDSRTIKNAGIVMFGATNRPRDLDPALIRPGRFSQVISVLFPNKKKRRAILKLCLQRAATSTFNFNGFKRKEKSKEWRYWLIRTKGKSPSYLAIFSNLSTLYQRVNPNTHAFLQRSEVIWNRLETETNCFGIYLKEENRKTRSTKYARIWFQNFLKLRYRKRRNFLLAESGIKHYWRKFFYPFRKNHLYSTAKKEKQEIIRRGVSMLVIENINPLTNNFSIEKMCQILKYKKEQVLNKNRTIRHIIPSEKNQKLSFFDSSYTRDYTWVLIKERRITKDWPSQWGRFEIPELIGFQSFSWIPPDKHIIKKHNYRMLFNNKDHKIKSEITNLTLLCIHKSRVKIDFLFTQDIVTSLVSV